jgi:hypothetical protein
MCAGNRTGGSNPPLSAKNSIRLALIERAGRTAEQTRTAERGLPVHALPSSPSEAKPCPAPMLECSPPGRRVWRSQRRGGRGGRCSFDFLTGRASEPDMYPRAPFRCRRAFASADAGNLPHHCRICGHTSKSRSCDGLRGAGVDPEFNFACDRGGGAPLCSDRN